MDKLHELAEKWKDNRKLIHTAAVIIVIIAAVFIFGPFEKSSTITVADKPSAASSESSSAESSQPSDEASGSLYVDVGGEVKDPGVYELPAGARVFDGIEKAGGLTGKADTSLINQAERVKDGQKIFVPRKGKAGQSGSGASSAQTSISSGTSSGAGSSASSAGSAGGKININTADSAALQQISGVGPVTAQKIIEYREQNGGFQKIEDLMNVSGIGEKTFAKLKSSITI